MKQFFLLSFMILAGFAVVAQPDDTQSMHETARGFMRSGDFDNAIIVLKRALEKDPKNLELQKDLVQSYYYKRDYTRAMDGAEALVDHRNADVASFQIAGNVYKAVEDVKEAEKAYKKGLKKFPDSGPLYSEYGELLWAQQDYNAIKQWEKGIEVDPAYSGNYYNAALYYYYTKDKVWTLIYGEIFANMESLTERGAAMKKLLLDTYKEKLFAEADLMAGENENRNEFSRAFLESMNAQNSLASRGINTEVLTMIRTRFILDWFEKHGERFPFRLFDYHRQLLQMGMFESYNQWLFGAVEDLASFDAWTQTHADEYSKFEYFQKGRVFRMPKGQYYQDKDKR